MYIVIKETSLLYQPCKLVWLTNPTFERIFQTLPLLCRFKPQDCEILLVAIQGSKLEKSSVTNWRNIVARCKFLVASLYNVNDAAHSMARSV